jgi:hypothetical protein
LADPFVGNGVTRRLSGDKPRHYIFDQAYRPDYRCQVSASPQNGQPNRKRNSEKANIEGSHTLNHHNFSLRVFLSKSR